MKVKAEKEWLVVCPKCNEEYHLSDEEFSGNETMWSCFKCNLEFGVWRDNAGVLHTGIAPSLEKAVEEAQKFGFSL